MADEIRSVAALQTLLADNTTGQISPQDLRDFLVSIAVAGADCSSATPLVHNLSAATWTKIGNVTVFGDPGNGQFSMPVDNRLLNVSPNSVSYGNLVILAIELEGGTANKSCHLGIYKNGALAAVSRSGFITQGSGREITVYSTLGDLMAPGDYYEGWIWCESAESLTINTLRLGFVARLT